MNVDSIGEHQDPTPPPSGCSFTSRIWLPLGWWAPRVVPAHEPRARARPAADGIRRRLAERVDELARLGFRPRPTYVSSKPDHAS